MAIVILEDAAEDLESGAQFYEGVRDGSWRLLSRFILSDLDSLILFAGVHPIYFGFHRMLSKRFPFGIYYGTKCSTSMPFWISDAIHSGFANV